MDHEEIEALFDEANRLLETGRVAECLRCLMRLDGKLLEDDDRIEHGALKAWALAELGRGREAWELLEPLIDEFPQSARLLTALGVVLSNAGDLEGACEALERAVELDEEDEVAVANLGLVYEKLREYEEALELYDRALEMGAEIDWLLPRKAAVQAELGRGADARATLRRYLSLAPDDAEQWIALAVLHSDDGQFEDAFRCYRAAEQIAPDSARLRLNWGVTAVRAHRADVAQQQLAYLARLEPDSSRTALLEAFVAEELEQLETAARKYADALARVRRDDYGDLAYALEMSMDFFARHGQVGTCEQLMEQAYRANACTVELCEAFREATGEVADKANWYSLMLEGDYRPGLVEVTNGRGAPSGPATRFLRNYQVIARDHDEAMDMVLRFAERMGESNVLVREFVGEEAVTDAHLGVYEVERESAILADSSR